MVAALLRPSLTSFPAIATRTFVIAGRKRAIPHRIARPKMPLFSIRLLGRPAQARSRVCLTLGDKRYNDQISDYSVKAVNDDAGARAELPDAPGGHRPTGFTDQEKISRDLLLREFAEDQEAAEFKEWEMPVNQMGGIHTDYPQLVAQLSFTTVKDYDDWIARLHAIPAAFDQVTTNMSIGMDDHRVPPKYLLEKALEQVKSWPTRSPKTRRWRCRSRSFPASIKPPSRSASRPRCSTRSQRSAAGLPALCALP
jgi:uncharacterized protein (DUF885 family)